jgi:hypothetical protein
MIYKTFFWQQSGFLLRETYVFYVSICVSALRRLISLGGNTGGHAWLDIDIYDRRGQILSPWLEDIVNYSIGLLDRHVNILYVAWRAGTTIRAGRLYLPARDLEFGLRTLLLISRIVLPLSSTICIHLLCNIWRFRTSCYMHLFPTELRRGQKVLYYMQ